MSKLLEGIETLLQNPVLESMVAYQDEVEQEMSDAQECDTMNGKSGHIDPDELAGISPELSPQDIDEILNGFDEDGDGVADDDDDDTTDESLVSDDDENDGLDGALEALLDEALESDDDLSSDDENDDDDEDDENIETFLNQADETEKFTPPHADYLPIKEADEDDTTDTEDIDDDYENSINAALDAAMDCND